jgi:hypothetical protein
MKPFETFSNGFIFHRRRCPNMSCEMNVIEMMMSFEGAGSDGNTNIGKCIFIYLQTLKWLDRCAILLVLFSSFTRFHRLLLNGRIPTENYVPRGYSSFCTVQSIDLLVHNRLAGRARGPSGKNRVGPSRDAASPECLAVRTTSDNSFTRFHTRTAATVGWYKHGNSKLRHRHFSCKPPCEKIQKWSVKTRNLAFFGNSRSRNDSSFG